MISLFLDTSSSYLNAFVVKDNVVLKSIYKLMEKDMSKYSLYLIKEMLDELNLKPNDIDKIMCVTGPGSFTGLRVGVTIAKTFAWGLNKKLTEISSLFTMATCVEDKDYIIPIIDARREFFFAAIYDKKYNKVLEECYIKKEELLEKVNKLDGTYTFVSTTNIKDIETKKYEPNIENFLNNLQEKEIEPHKLVPNYLKKTEAEENLNDKRN